MKVLTKEVQFEEKIKNSRFLSELIPCESQNQARDIKSKMTSVGPHRDDFGFIVGITGWDNLLFFGVKL